MLANFGNPAIEYGPARSGPRAGLLVAWSCLVLWGPSLPASPDREEVAGHCPYGHEALEKVRIDQRGRTSRDSPRYNIVCQQCGARDARLLVGDEWVRDPNWVRDSMDPESFELPSAELIRGFPAISPVGGNSPNYRQQFARGNLWNEALHYSSSAEYEEIALAVLDYLDNFGAPYRLTQEHATGFELLIEDPGYRTSVTTSCSDGHCRVAVGRMWQLQKTRARPAAGRGRAREDSPVAVPTPRRPATDSPRPKPAPPLVFDEPIDLANIPQHLAEAGFIPPEKQSAPPPQYSEEARKARIQGKVNARLHLSKSGDVLSVEILEGPPLLAKKAAEAFNRWKFEPARLRDEAVEVYWYGTVGFSLQ